MRLFLLACAAVICLPVFAETRIATFNVDVTPPMGAPLCGGGRPAAKGVDDPLSARGVVLLPEGQEPVVLCAVDWIGIANSAWDAWRAAIAKAAGTSPDRVAVQSLHQHDAPFCDFATNDLLADNGLGGMTFDVAFAREAIAKTAEAVKAGLEDTVAVTHVSTGSGVVEEVAANRRILDAEGHVRAMRWTSCADPALRAEPVGTIDPLARLVAFWNEDAPVAILTYYAVHPQSHYGKGYVSADFPGLARTMREHALRDTVHVHFTGAGGNLGAGKYNDGSPENRALLGGRLALGLRRAWENAEKHALTDEMIAWEVSPVALPTRPEQDLDSLRKELASEETDPRMRVSAAREIAWIDRCNDGYKIEVSMLRIGDARIVHMPGELFVEYQLAAQRMAPDKVLCMAAYGDYGPGYIGTTVAYDEGGYETGLYTSRTAPTVEGVLLGALRELLVE
jgi:hypothetical protein